MRLVLFTIAVLLLASTPRLYAQSPQVRMLVQSSPLAGFQFHHGKKLWDEMKVGDVLTLVREPSNAHDTNAVRVDWRGYQLGYIPRRENRTVALHLDRGGTAEARISRLTAHRNPWQRVEFEVFVRL